MTEANRIHLVVLGTPEHEGRMCGTAFGNLGVIPTYIDPARPEIPSTPRADAILLSREWNVELRQAAAQARRAGIPVIYVMDGVIEWAYMWENWGFVKPEGTVLQPLIASDLCVVGRHPARILAALGLGARVHIVGMPRLDQFKRQRTLDQDQPSKIVIATAKSFGHNVAQKVFVRAALRDLKNWFDEHPDVLPIWRIAKDAAEEIGITPSSQASLMEELQTASAVLSFTSTVLLEAMHLGIPTAQIDYRSVPQYVQVAWEIRCADHIEGVIRELLYPPPEKIVFQEACLLDELELGKASARLAEVIREAVRREMNGEARPGEPERLKIGHLDYRQVHSHLSSFSVSPMSRLQYELDATYKLWERERLKLAKLRDEVADLREDRVATILQRLSWLPGFRRTARLIKRLVSSIA